jgi:hypothetical protein
LCTMGDMQQTAVEILGDGSVRCFLAGGAWEASPANGNAVLFETDAVCPSAAVLGYKISCNPSKAVEITECFRQGSGDTTDECLSCVTTAKLGSGQHCLVRCPCTVPFSKFRRRHLVWCCTSCFTATQPTGWLTFVIRVNELTAAHSKGRSPVSAIYTPARGRRSDTCLVPPAFTAELNLLPDQSS